MCFRFIYTVQLDTAYQKVLYNSYLPLFLRHGIKKIKDHVCTSEAWLRFTQKNNFCIMNKIKLAETIFLSKNVNILYILKNFFTMLHLQMFLKYWIILYIFRISLCIMTPYNNVFMIKIFLRENKTFRHSKI